MPHTRDGDDFIFFFLFGVKAPSVRYSGLQSSFNFQVLLEFQDVKFCIKITEMMIQKQVSLGCKIFICILSKAGSGRYLDEKTELEKKKKNSNF